MVISNSLTCGGREADASVYREIWRQWCRLEISKEPREETLKSENGVQGKRAEKAEEHEARCILSERHFYCGISPGDAVDEEDSRQ